LGVFFPTDNALYSIVSGAHTKTAEPIEMPFGMKTRVGTGNYVLDRVQMPLLGERAIFGCCLGHSKTFAIFAAAVAAALLRHPLQKGIIHMPGKRK